MAKKGRICSICAHKKRCQIDAEYIKTADIRGVSRKFRVSEDALGRHVNKGHVSKDIVEADKAGKIENGLNLQKCANEIYDLCLDAAKTAKNEDLRAFGSCISPAVKVLEVLNKGNEGKPPENQPRDSGFFKSYTKRAGEVYESQSPPS